ncbi:MAG: phage integrase SAM-like domain-containing protein [Planctomycetaceae bacterium]|nr:phage integrase SAM-like domain-containing protein [Planctomycetaceae bacterium]
MSINLETTIEAYLKAKNLSQGTRDEYRATLRKWKQWRTDTPLVEIDRKTVRDFLGWVYENAIEEEGTNPGRTANKARENLRAVMSWAWEQDLIESLPRFPRPRPQRVVAGRHYLTKAELNALYFATFQMKRPRGWDAPFTIGRYWRCALVLFFNYGMDTGTFWGTLNCHKLLLWRHVSWDRVSLDGQRKERCRWGWLFYKRVKTGKTFHRPMNRIVYAHLKSIRPEEPDPNAPVVLGGGTRPNIRFQQLCELVGIGPKTDVETGEQKPWVLKDLRKTCATYYDAHVPESSIEILGHSMGGVTYRHYAHRDPLAFKAIMTIPQPAAFKALARGIDGRCPCCRRAF